MINLTHMRSFPLDEAFKLIEPGPVVMLTTSHKNRPNVMTMSWHMDVDFVPIIACVVSEGDYSFQALARTKECVIAIPGVDLIKKVVDIGNCSGRDIDKFAAFKLTPVPAKEVQAPLIKECLFNIECRVIDTRCVKKYNLFILEGVKAWQDSTRSEKRTFHALGDGTFAVDGRIIDLRERMTKWQD
jgi:flavin reductase (DIM6/NTAB) family NADH-FMN oxidoreductase RutF